MSSEYHQPIQLSSINPSRGTLSISPSYSKQSIIICASGLVINILDPLSWRLLQSIKLIDHLPHLANSQNSVDVLCLTEDNRRLAACCGRLTAIFERSGPSWKLHSTFTSQITRILSINLKQTYCLVTGEDGLSLHELEEESSDSDEPARWIKRWALRGQPCDQSALEILEDGTCLLVTIVVGSPILRTYEFSTSSSSEASPDGHQYSPKTITLSLPIHSIRFLYRKHSPQGLPTLAVEVVAPVLGKALHYYNLIKRPFSNVSGNPIQENYVGRHKPQVQYLHRGMCAVSVPTNSPRILAMFPSDNLPESFLSQNEHLTGHDARLNVIVLSNGAINLARSTKNTTLLSTNPLHLPTDMLELFKRPATTIHSVMSVTNTPGKPGDLICSIVARSLTPTGEIFVAQISLNTLLVRPIVANPRPRFVSIKRLPYGYTPLFSRLSFVTNKQDAFAGLVVAPSAKDKYTKYICLCNPAGNRPTRGSRLLAHAFEPDQDTSTARKNSTGRVQVTRHSGDHGRHCKNDSSNFITEDFHLELTGLFVTHLNRETHFSIQRLLCEKIGLKGFLEEEIPEVLVMECLDIQPSSVKNGGDGVGYSVLCLSSSNRLLLWNIPEGSLASDSDSRPHISAQEVSFPASFLISTMASTSSSSLVVLALDDNGQLVRATLPESRLLENPTQPLELKVTMSHQIGSQETLGLTDLKSQVILIELQQSRFLAMLCVMNETDRIRTYRVVIVDLRQQPYSAGIVGLDTFEVERASNEVGNDVQLEWSEYQSRDNTLQNDCFLGVCCGINMVRIYTRASDGWWRQTTTVHSELGSISQISWLAESDHSSRLLYQTKGNTLLGPPINIPERLSLPLWHPIIIKNQVLFGSFSISFATVACLSLALKGCLQPLTLLCNRIATVDLQDEEVLIVKQLDNLANGIVLPGDMSPTILSQAHVDIISSAVNALRIPLLSPDEQVSIMCLTRALLQVQTARTHGVDGDGCQYIFSLVNRLEQHPAESRSDSLLGFGPSQDCGILSAQLSSTRGLIGQETMSILSQDSGQPGSKLDWKAARSVGLFMWLEPGEELDSYLEKVAQAEYVSGGTGDSNKSSLDKTRPQEGTREQDPAACSIFYVALKKKRLLMGLWKVAYGHADRPLMTKFLQNDFSEARWKTAAQKNAFALISRQRFRFAASFFLLADRLQDAVNVCVRQLSDWQLALAIVRAYEGDRGPVMEKLLKETVLPLGFSTGTRWLISWSFRILGESELACRVLVAAWDDPLIRNHWTPSDSESFGVRIGPIDLSLIVLFNRLKRELRSPLTWKEERLLILLVMEELTNAGCARLAAGLAKTWHIDRPELPLPSTIIRPKTPIDSQQHLNSPGPSSPSPSVDHQLSIPNESHIPTIPKKKLIIQNDVPEFELSSFF
ncbi:hypothetical protein MJO28_002089 [Puccinia striiformis f. sp. tritici]|uniref:RAVE complex protein Rav1 C-terminal domain-containing protein n=4 Tax=Puccinia striiformis f. sp. tritici TaxID=168172 RepID=A0A0L0W2Y7_9BASI|nr:hypothetical protein MJO28_002089 [Puccinia striiformis f. sp. tritici]KAI7966415.1 hypothetical protein MJO29_002163 [Puccinia striiformis f. sp. tritici]KNF05907.1 hypothetical protein PSTG_00900 [Puccinia striiformis f. sp. tritici PST-78]KNF05908.1 hypothetical protein, variant [Puccinia striiformis f. sp. tritici PST-78]